MIVTHKEIKALKTILDLYKKYPGCAGRFFAKWEKKERLKISKAEKILVEAQIMNIEETDSYRLPEYEKDKRLF